LKRKQALLRSNLSAINFLHYTVEVRGDGILYCPFFTGIALWLKKPISLFSSSQYSQNKNPTKTTFYQ